MKTLAEFLEVEEGQRFEFNKYTNAQYRVNNNTLECWNTKRETWEVENGARLIDFINALQSGITLISYSPSTIEAAKHDSYRFKYVARENNDSIVLTLLENEPYEVDDRGLDVWIADYGIRCTIPYTEYPEVKPGQCVELREIVGGDNE